MDEKNTQALKAQKIKLQANVFLFIAKSKQAIKLFIGEEQVCLLN